MRWSYAIRIFRISPVIAQHKVGTMNRIRPNRLNWNLLRAFCGIAEHRTLADAARAAGVQRPTISEKVAELEAGLGHRLIDRQPGNDRFRLTSHGTRLRRLLIEFNR